MQELANTLDLPPLSPYSDDWIPALLPAPDDFPLDDTCHTALFVVTPTFEPCTKPAPVLEKNLKPVVVTRKDKDQRKEKVEKYRLKRAKRKYERRVSYQCRKIVADRRLRVKGRFVTKQEELSLRSNTD